MLGDRWSSGVPDDLPEDRTGDIDAWDEIDRLHSQLRLTIQTNRERQREALEKYGVVIDPSNELRARLNLLTDMFIGTISTERLHFEMNWQKMMSEAVEDGIATVAEQRRQDKLSKTLHLPNGRSHKVAPKELNDEG